MLRNILDWFGFGSAGHGAHGRGGHGHGHGDQGGDHGHTHGVIDATIATTTEGINAIKWSFVILAATAIMQLVVVYFSRSVALLADTIHNIGDATTAIPLWIAFVLARRPATKVFNYGLGRVEDLAGIVIVLIILLSAIVAGYESIDHLINPRPVEHLGWLIGAGIVGFAGNEIVAVLRIRTGRRINSAALIADGYHARTAVLLAVVANTLVTRTIVGAGQAPALELISRVLLIGVGSWLLLRAILGRPHAHGEGVMAGVVAGLIPCPLTLFLMFLRRQKACQRLD